jgi:4-hydroxy-3-methylbut-2-enyl diphosphate reductase IspH
VGLTAGASTPNNVVGEVLKRVLALRHQTVDDLVEV